MVDCELRNDAVGMIGRDVEPIDMGALARQAFLNFQVKSSRVVEAVEAPRDPRLVGHDENIVAAIVQIADRFDRAWNELQVVRPMSIALVDIDDSVPIEERGGTHPDARKLVVSLLERLGQSDVEEISCELAARNLASLDESGKDVPFK